MNQATEQLEVRGVLLPLHSGQLLLPNVSISEVAGYRTPEAPPEDVPDWLLGILTWRQFTVPLISFDNRLGYRQWELGHRARIAICNTITGRAGRHYIGILLRSIPHLVRVTEEAIEPLGEVLNGNVTLARQVKIGDQEAWIPDLDNLEEDLVRILD